MRYGERGWSQVTAENPEVKTGNGRVMGFCRGGNAVFLGIPYGAHCDGEGRFLAPRPAPHWEGVRDCTRNGAIAMQEQTDMEMLPEPVRKVMQEYGDVFTGGQPCGKEQDRPDENCLFLNVVTPGLEGDLRPVVVYIHGGGYVTGSGNVTAAISDRLLDEENLVLVTVNHRLNVFGTLYLGGFDPAYRESGILTQLDLLLALQWIQENIGAFGGDAGNVTLMGESGGGSKIHHLLAMPESRGLLHKAIIISGSIPCAVKTPEEGTRETLQVMEKLGVAREDWRRLLTMPAEELVKGVRGMELMQPDQTPFMPTADGVRMPANPEGTFGLCARLSGIPMIVGSSEEELATNLLNPGLTWEELERQLLKRENPLLTTMPGIREANVKEVVEVFQRACGDSKEPWQILLQIVSMNHYLGNGSYLAALAWAEAGVPVWHYMTAYDTPLPGAGGLACAWHTADLPLAFRAVYHPEAEELSRTIAHSFAAFARTGSPETERMDWPAFTAGEKETMVFDRNSGWKKNPYGEIYSVIEDICPVFRRVKDGTRCESKNNATGQVY